MSSKDLNNNNLNTINSVDPILNLNNNPDKENDTKQKDKNKVQNEENKYKKICSKLKEINYDDIFEDEFIEDFVENDLEFFEKIRKEKSKEKNKQKENEIIYKTKIMNKKEIDDTEQIETENKDNSKDIANFINNEKELEKDKKKEKNIINNKFNIIKIYIDLKNLYTENINKNIFSEDFIIFANNLIEHKNKDDLVKKFDMLYQRIKVNLYGKMSNLFSRIFFRNIEPKMLIFFNRFYMLRVFISMKTDGKKLNKISIINENNHFNTQRHLY